MTNRLTEQQLQEELLDEIGDFTKAITKKIGQGVGAVQGAGQKVKGVRDSQSGSTIVINKSIIRSPAKYIMIDKSGKMTTLMKLGPMTSKAAQQAGLEEGKAETKICKDCGDTFNKPTTDCKHDSHDPKGSHWVDANGNGIGDLDEGNAFSKALAKAKDNDEDEMEVDGKKIPVTEFILSMFDRDSGKFPKGETAILTAIEKDYGEQYINTGKAFIEAITAKFEELNVASEPMIDEIEEPTTGTVMEPTVEQDDDLSDIRRLSGL